MDATKVYSDLLAAYVNPLIRIIALKGGTRSGKTWAVLMLLDFIARHSTVPRLISAVSETMPHLKKGAIRDFKKILETDDIYNPALWHDTDKTYSYGKAVLEFFSADQASKVHGPAREVLYINECINLDYEVYRQLSVRTTEKIILDYNPAFEFWVDSKLAPREDVVVLQSTYKDNDMLTASQISEIESNILSDPDWFKVYGLGETGSRKGLVIKNWDIVKEMPTSFKREFIGIDYGWSAPTAIMHVGLAENNEVFIDEIAYLSNLDNPTIAQIVKDAGLSHLEVLADIAEPKSNKELRNLGLNVALELNKDIKLGIQVMNRFVKHYTERSLGSIKENRMYHYPENAEGELALLPVDKHNHAKDAERYVFLNRLSNLSGGYDVTVGTARRK